MRDGQQFYLIYQCALDVSASRMACFHDNYILRFSPIFQPFALSALFGSG